MTILVPWKPVVLIWLLLSAMVLAGYFGSCLIKGTNPFVPYPSPIDRSHAPPQTPKDTSNSPALTRRDVAGREQPR
jgi:hypothetical protein